MPQQAQRPEESAALGPEQELLESEQELLELPVLELEQQVLEQQVLERPRQPMVSADSIRYDAEHHLG